MIEKLPYTVFPVNMEWCRSTYQLVCNRYIGYFFNVFNLFYFYGQEGRRSTSYPHSRRYQWVFGREGVLHVWALRLWGLFAHVSWKSSKSRLSSHQTGLQLVLHQRWCSTNKQNKNFFAHDTSHSRTKPMNACLYDLCLRRGERTDVCVYNTVSRRLWSIFPPVSTSLFFQTFFDAKTLIVEWMESHFCWKNLFYNVLRWRKWLPE